MPNSDFTIENGVLKRYTGTAKDVVIPNGVTYIPIFTFRDHSEIISISIPKSVTYIGHCAFSGCTALTSISIPEGITDIPPSTFARCKGLKSIYIPNSIVFIGNAAFYGCDELKIHAPKGSYAEWYAKENNIPFVVE